ncbi:unnamed protein product [Prunus armeniaca]
MEWSSLGLSPCPRHPQSLFHPLSLEVGHSRASRHLLLARLVAQVVLSTWRIVYAVYWWTKLARNSLWLVARNWLFQNEPVSIFLHVSHEEDREVDLLGSLISHECFFTSPNLSCTLVLGPSLEWRFDLLRLELADACDMPACWAVCSYPLPSLLVPARPTW